MFTLFSEKREDKLETLATHDHTDIPNKLVTKGFVFETPETDNIFFLSG